MKVNVLGIVIGHVLTLGGSVSERIIDACTFVALPIMAAVASSYYLDPLREQFFNSLISVYSIFAALLLNAQVAVFGIFEARRNIKLNSLTDKRAEKTRIELMRQVNTNISYLILLSVLSVVIYLILLHLSSNISSASIKNACFDFVAYFLLYHFVVSLMMVVKRSHALFQGEYDQQASAQKRETVEGEAREIAAQPVTHITAPPAPAPKQAP